MLIFIIKRLFADIYYYMIYIIIWQYLPLIFFHWEKYSRKTVWN